MIRKTLRHRELRLFNLLAALVLPWLFSLIQPAPAFAQTANSSEIQPGAADGTLSEVVVTAQRRSQSLQDVPIAVSVVTGDILTDSSIDQGLELPRITPGLTIVSGGGQSSPFIRGVGTSLPNLGLESSVATYLDDQYLSRPVSGYYSLNDMERVEVLKGPQGTLYGRNATGGAIRLITNDPSNDLEASGSVTTGSFSRFGADAVLNVPLGERVQARLTVDYDKNDGYVRDIATGQNLMTNDILTTRLKIKAEPSDVLTLKLTAEYSDKDDNSGGSFINLYGAPEQLGIALGGQGSTSFYTAGGNGGLYSDGGYGRYANWTPYDRVRGSGLQLRADLDLGFATLTSISGWFRSQMDEATDIDATSLPLEADFFLEDSNSYSQEFDLVSKPGGPLTWTGGLYYYKELGRTEFDIFGSLINESFGVPDNPNTGGYAGGAALNAVGHVQVESFAPFADLTYAFTDQLEITLGARWTSEHKTLLDNHVYATNVAATGLGPLSTIYSESGLHSDFTNFSPRVVLSYKPVAKTLFYASYSEGFKSGGINTPAFGPADTVKPEILHAYELGWKTEIGKIRFNGEAYYYHYTDLQVQRNDLVTGGNITLNAADAQIFGVDSELLYAVNRAFEVGVGANYNHSKFLDFIGEAYVPAAGTSACAAAGGGLAAPCLGFALQNENFAGQQLPLAPTLTGYLREKYSLDLGNNGSVIFNSLLSYSSSYSYDPPNRLLLEPSKYLLSAGAKWKSANGHYELAAFGDNILNRRYDIYQTVTGIGAMYMPGAPRSWGLTFGYKL
jgi:iron complex outermembrane receptor protein